MNANSWLASTEKPSTNESVTIYLYKYFRVLPLSFMDAKVIDSWIPWLAQILWTWSLLIRMRHFPGESFLSRILTGPTPLSFHSLSANLNSLALHSYNISSSSSPTADYPNLTNPPQPARKYTSYPTEFMTWAQANSIFFRPTKLLRATQSVNEKTKICLFLFWEKITFRQQKKIEFSTTRRNYCDKSMGATTAFS